MSKKEKDVICTDVGNTLLGRGNVIINPHIHQALHEFHANGKEIWILTDGDEWDGDNYKRALRNNHPNNINFVSKVITYDTFDLYKSNRHYWANVKNSTGKQPNNLILIDDDYSVINQAKENNVNVVDSGLSPENFRKELDEAVAKAHTPKP